MIDFHFIDVEVPNFDSELFVFGIGHLIHSEKRICGDVNVVFCTDDYLLEMNKLHLDHDYYTDIITFDYCYDNVVSGDLFISVDRVKDNARGHNVSLMNELCRVCAHGVLHLCGYGDKGDDEALVMREKEDLYIPFFRST
jgi:probable rRNA maturation factor